MYEFDSVSVSAFEAEELAATLTAKSAEGWDVAGIVTAGSDVVAYLRRSVASESAKEGASQASDSAEESQPISTLSAESTPASAEPAAASTASSDALAGSTSGGTSADTTNPAGTGGTGWGASTDTSASTGGWGTSDASGSGGSWGGSAQQTNAPVAQTAPSVPAGWYADPAGRYELRYWDGGAWTEHVSRAGQQYTDPPVA